MWKSLAHDEENGAFAANYGPEHDPWGVSEKTKISTRRVPAGTAKQSCEPIVDPTLDHTAGAMEVTPPSSAGDKTGTSARTHDQERGEVINTTATSQTIPRPVEPHPDT